MDDALVLTVHEETVEPSRVLILVVMDDALVPREELEKLKSEFVS